MARSINYRTASSSTTAITAAVTIRILNASTPRCSKAYSRRRSMVDELRTERLLLRRATMDDLNAVHAMLSDAKAMRYWSTPPHEDLVQTEAWLRSMVDSDSSQSDDYLLEKDGEVIGKLGCWRLPEI